MIPTSVDTFQDAIPVKQRLRIEAFQQYSVQDGRAAVKEAQYPRNWREGFETGAKGPAAWDSGSVPLE
ncbi:hypothetical protein Vi05172_g8479 [Venturia inaequalis]|nr:hypothetical protein Vi05172_g8479 [Venturia inaequalis]